MRIKFYGVLRDEVGHPAVTLPMPPGQTVGEVLHEVTRVYPQIRRRIFTPDGALQPDLLIALGGIDIRHGGDLAAKVSPGDDLLIFPPGAGG